MTEDEALDLALEALDIQAYNSGDEKYTQAVTAIKQARSISVQEPDLAKAYREELDKLSQRNYEWEPRANMCLFLVEYLKDTIEKEKA